MIEQKQITVWSTKVKKSLDRSRSFWEGSKRMVTSTLKCKELYATCQRKLGLETQLIIEITSHHKQRIRCSANLRKTENFKVWPVEITKFFMIQQKMVFASFLLLYLLEGIQVSSDQQILLEVTWTCLTFLQMYIIQSYLLLFH